MKTRKQLLADFYLDLLAIPTHDKFRNNHTHLYASLRHSLAKELDCTEQHIQIIFERMASEDR